MPSDAHLRPVAEIGRVERLIAMRSFPGCNDVAASELALLSAVAIPRMVRANEALVTPGRLATSAFLVVEGELVVRRTHRELARIHPRDWKSVLLPFAGDAELECIAACDSVVLELPVEDLEDVLEDRIALLVRVVAELSRASIDLRRRIPLHAGFAAETASSAAVLPSRTLDIVERIFFLRQSRAFRGARIDGVTALAEIASELRKDGRELWCTGDPSGSMLAVLGGSVIASTSHGHRFVFGPGEIVGWLDTMGSQRRWYDAVAGNDFVALALERDAMIDVWEDHPDLGIEALRTLSSAMLVLLSQP